MKNLFNKIKNLTPKDYPLNTIRLLQFTYNNLARRGETLTYIQEVADFFANNGCKVKTSNITGYKIKFIGEKK